MRETCPSFPFCPPAPPPWPASLSAASNLLPHPAQRAPPRANEAQARSSAKTGAPPRPTRGRERRGRERGAPGGLAGMLRRGGASRTPRAAASRTERTDTGRERLGSCASAGPGLAGSSVADARLWNLDTILSDRARARAISVLSDSEELFGPSCSIAESSTSSRNGWPSFSDRIVALMTCSAFSRSPELSMKKTMGAISSLSSCQSSHTYKC